MPTAVMTESSEKTMSSSMICTITPANDAAPPSRRRALLALELLVDLVRALGEQEEAAERCRIRSRPEISCADHREERRA